MSLTKDVLRIMTVMAFGLIPAGGFAQCSGTGHIIMKEVNCCGRLVTSNFCQGFSGMCDPLNTYKQCPGTGCEVGNAGCGFGAPVKQATVQTENRQLLGAAAPKQTHPSFVESACGRKKGPGFNAWLAIKLREKQQRSREPLRGM